MTYCVITFCITFNHLQEVIPFTRITSDLDTFPGPITRITHFRSPLSYCRYKAGSAAPT